ncbi:MAG: 7-cyano-7-deazaguanine synthase QueC [Thermoplasmata archaeon]|nr:7-cyano-7-deazaguanine synthase QueC [Thermoplasmata archaeon]
MKTALGGRSASLVLLSGGMDSATCLAEACGTGEPVHALSIVYGQRHARETESARALARHFGIAHHTVLPLRLGALLSSSLTDRSRPIPRRSRARGGSRIPSTYVPARNTIFLSVALGYAESHRLDRIYVGVNAVDYSGYPDCRPEFLRAFQRLARLATRAGVEGNRPVRIVAPLLRLTKSEIVRRGSRLGVPWELTWSCYVGGRRPCGECDACRFREKGFREAGMVDPLTSPRPRGGPTGSRYRTRTASR